MGKKDKLIGRLLQMPRDFTFSEVETLFGLLSFDRSDKGKTSGSRVAFVNKKSDAKIILHKPHPRKELLEYQIKQIIEFLKEEGLIDEKHN